MGWLTSALVGSSSRPRRPARQLSSTTVSEPGPDLTTRVHELEAQLAASEEEREVLEHRAARAERAMKVFYAALSHELFTPLNAVIGYAELLRDDLADGIPEEPTAATHDLDRIVDSARRLHGLLQRFVELSRIETQRDRAFLEWFDFGQVVDEALERVRPLAWEREVALDLDLQIKRVHTRLDRSRVATCVEVLVRHACELNPGAPVQVRVTAEPLTQSLAIEVSDDGPAIPPLYRDLAFEVFPEVPNSVERLRGRRSIDLSLAAKNAELMGGGLHLLARDQGCTFVLQVPIDASRHLLTFDEDPPEEAEVLLEDAPESEPIAPPRAPKRPRVPQPTLVPAPAEFTRTAKPQRAGRRTLLTHAMSLPPDTSAIHPPETRSQRGAVVLVQSDPQHQQAQAEALAEEGWVVHPCAAADEAVHLAMLERPDVFVVDWLHGAPDLWDLRRLAYNRGLDGVPLVLLACNGKEQVTIPIADLLGGPVERADLTACLERVHPRLGGSVLLIEDPTQPYSLRPLIERAGWKVTCDGELDATALGNGYELILVDLYADDFECLGAAIERSSQPTWSSIPVVLVVPRELTPGAPARLQLWLQSDLRPRTENPLSLSEAVDRALDQSRSSPSQS